MKISVVICTWNRASLLDQSLTQMCKLNLPAGLEWELIVVNNNCSDNTDAVIDQHANALPLRKLVQPIPGKSSALNLAIAEAHGELTVFTDDDVLVDPHWLASYVHATRRWPEAAFFGGPVLPRFEGTPPSWIKRNWTVVANAFATRDFGPQPMPFTARRVPFGANMAVKTDIHRRYPYDTALGPQPDSMIRGGEETTLIRAMLADGLKGRWVPGATVKHFIPKARQSRQYLRRFYMGQGAFLAHNQESKDLPKLFGRPRWLWRAAIQAELKYQLCRFVTKPETWIKDLIRSSKLWGQIIHSV